VDEVCGKTENSFSLMRNIRLAIEYDGTRFSGWQRQAPSKRFRTIQEEIEKAGKRLFGKKIKLIGAGRTDRGVHAEGQVANFKVETNLPLSNIKKGLNSHLPKDIAVLSAETAKSTFHARFNAKGKLYRYRILNRDVRSPLLQRFSGFSSYELDIDAMKKAARYLVGKRDFKSFQASDKKKKSSVRTIKRLEIIKRAPLIDIYIQGDGFLYNMVRNIVGTLIDVGRGRIKPDSVKDILSKRHRPSAGQTAHAKGLSLLKVIYKNG